VLDQEVDDHRALFGIRRRRFSPDEVSRDVSVLLGDEPAIIQVRVIDVFPVEQAASRMRARPYPFSSSSHAPSWRDRTCPRALPARRARLAAGRRGSQRARAHDIEVARATAPFNPDISLRSAKASVSSTSVCVTSDGMSVKPDARWIL